ncbi:MAG: GNAT family N-acetyltransferase [Bdellovibrionales bacterium]|nr:GNAT family N-acetyltransferase [Bdellovibrionales bacterium]
MNEISFRFAISGELQAVKTFDPETPEDVLKFKIEHQLIGLAIEQTKVIGYLRLDPIWNKIPYIGLIWIQPDYRGKKVGSRFLAWLEKELILKKHNLLFSSSQTDEIEPQEWHRKVGFSDCGVIQDINGPGVGELFFSKSLLQD